LPPDAIALLNSDALFEEVVVKIPDVQPRYLSQLFHGGLTHIRGIINESVDQPFDTMPFAIALPPVCPRISVMSKVAACKHNEGLLGCGGNARIGVVKQPPE